MRFRYFLLLMFAGSFVSLYAQENIRKDTIRMDGDSLRNFSGEEVLSSPVSGKGTDVRKVDVQLPEYPDSGKINIPLSGSVHVPPYFINRSPMFYGDYSTSGQIAPGFYGSGSQTTLPGFGRMNQVAFGYQYALTDYLEVQAGVSAIKYSFPMSVGASFGASGSLIYHPSGRFRLTAFGTFTPADRYGFHQNSYGLTMGYDFTDRLGIEAGVRRYYDPQRGWQTAPVATPYYKFNKFTLGVDVGGILYEVLRNMVVRNRQGNSPTIMPPGR